jgi:hypothetical protein
MKTRLHAGVALALCACVTGCAVSPAPAKTAAVAAGTIPAERVRGAVTIGKSTKADVIAALGNAMVISFESGFEVWVYYIAGDAPPRSRGAAEKETPGKAEFVVLFAPSGIVTKTRIRPA